jgi:predicted Fe-Mo cluster-binding NifX family protein
MDLEVLDNGRNRNALKGAGIQAATIAGEAGVEAVLTGFCGPNAFKVLNTAGIKVVNDVSGSVLDAVVKFKNKGYSFAAEANVEGNW